MKIIRLVVLDLSFVILAAWPNPLWALESRLSAAVAVVSNGPAIEQFLQKPGGGYVQAYVRFDSNMPDDVIMAIDQEFLEGVSKPLYFAGGDWMAFVGVQRSGAIWIAAGSAATTNGVPSMARNWQIMNLGTRLQPNVWYLLRIEADFGKRHFKSFAIAGPGINMKLDLSAYPLDYPNYMPFSARAMIYVVAAMRSVNMMKDAGTPIAYFDDVQGGAFWSNGMDRPVFANGFEQQATVTAQPPASPVIDLNGYVQGQWYLERAESLFTIQHVPFTHSGSAVGVHSGSAVGVADARLN